MTKVFILFLIVPGVYGYEPVRVSDFETMAACKAAAEGSLNADAKLGMEWTAAPGEFLCIEGRSDRG